MKRLVLVLSVVVGAWMFSPTPEAQAWGWSGSKQGSSHRQNKGGKHHKAKHQKGKSATGKGVTGGATVPELDPGAAGSAIVLLLGGTAWIASRRRDEELV